MSEILEELIRLTRQFQDRQPALLKEIRVHPDYYPVFLGDLQEAGVRRVTALPPLSGVPIYQDAEIPYGEVRQIFSGDDGGGLNLAE